MDNIAFGNNIPAVSKDLKKLTCWFYYENMVEATDFVLPSGFLHIVPVTLT